MDLNFCNEVLDYCGRSQDIEFVANEHKGFISLLFSLNFKDMSHREAFLAFEEQIEWANQKLRALTQKYPARVVKCKTLTLDDAEHFDHYFQHTKQAPQKKEMQTDEYTMVGYIQFTR